MTAESGFFASDVILAAAVATIIEATLFLGLAAAGNRTHIRAREDEPPPPIPIEVKPVVDDLPLLKLGSKRVRAKLPDMWVKKPPLVKRYEAASAPSPSAENDVSKIPDTPLVKPSAEAPPPDAAIAKKVDEVVRDAGPPPKQAPQLAQEGAEDGVKSGTETDPLKAAVVSQYRMKLAAWFLARFKRPAEIPCEEVKKLRASVQASVGGERAVTGYAVSKPSGNPVFDARVHATLDSIVSSGAELPPPPPNYPDILGTTISVAFFVSQCDQ